MSTAKRSKLSQDAELQKKEPLTHRRKVVVLEEDTPEDSEKDPLTASRLTQGKPTQTKTMKTSSSRKNPRSDSPAVENSSETQDASPSRRPLSEVDVVKDVLKKCKKESGEYSFLPLSSGRMVDVWLKPIQCEIEKAAEGKADKMSLTCKILIDSCPNMLNPDGKRFIIKFRSDAEEIMKICYLMDRFSRELHSERIFSFAEFRKMVPSVLENSCDLTEQEFAKQTFDYVNSQVTTRVPSSFQTFICKKPSFNYELPPSVMMINRNSLQCIAHTGFKYEYRIRLFICDKIDEEEIEEDGDDEEIPESQDPSI